MLCCEEYQFLDSILQTQLLWIDGVFLSIRKTERLHVELYALYDFYVEVFFDNETEDPLYLKSFDQVHLLDRYLEAIDISAAFSNYGIE